MQAYLKRKKFSPTHRGWLKWCYCAVNTYKHQSRHKSWCFWLICKSKLKQTYKINTITTPQPMRFKANALIYKDGWHSCVQLRSLVLNSRNGKMSPFRLSLGSSLIFFDTNIMDHHLIQGSANVSCERPDDEYVRLCTPRGLPLQTTHLCGLSSSQPLQAIVNRWTWLCSNKTLFTHTGARQNSARGPGLPLLIQSIIFIMSSFGLLPFENEFHFWPLIYYFCRPVNSIIHSQI